MEYCFQELVHFVNKLPILILCILYVLYVTFFAASPG